ncbi:MAG: DUF1624 domain-containing protein [Lachnospiraceae bacterium]|nr:DUF1624 domain-containing protein [Lachnospiraceae bacterium]
MKLFNACLTKEDVNTGRQGELDFLKAFLIIGMIGVHVFGDCFASDSVGSSESIFGYMTCLIGGASFMFAMGLSMQYSRRVNAKNMALRGLSLMAVAQLLNLGRNVLPNMIAYLLTGGKWFLAQQMLILQADILTFASLTFFLMAILLALKCTPRTILIVGTVMNLLSMAYNYAVTPPSNYLVSQIVGFFFITNAESYFPLFSYFFFVAFGYYVGAYYRRIRDKDRMCFWVFTRIVPICVVYYAIRFTVKIPVLPAISSDLQYCLQPFPDAVATSLVSIVILALFYKLIKAAFHGEAPKAIGNISSNVNRYFCVSYMIIMPLQTILIALYGKLPDGEFTPFLVSVGVFILCWVIIQIYSATLATPIQKMKPALKLGTYVLIFAASILVVIYVYPKLDVYPTIWNGYLISQVTGPGGMM